MNPINSSSTSTICEDHHRLGALPPIGSNIRHPVEIWASFERLPGPDTLPGPPVETQGPCFPSGRMKLTTDKLRIVLVFAQKGTARTRRRDFIRLDHDAKKARRPKGLC